MEEQVQTLMEAMVILVQMEEEAAVEVEHKMLQHHLIMVQVMVAMEEMVFVF
jgi:hypothetical protein